jgi:hypothetical protein
VYGTVSSDTVHSCADDFRWGTATELYNNWRTCSYTLFSQPSEAKNMADFQAKWRHFHDYWSLNSW